jgi:sugar phosphate isomerase/epimerase
MLRFGAMNNPSKNSRDEVLSIARDGFEFCDFTYEAPNGIITNVIARELKRYITKQMGFADFRFVGHTFYDLKIATEFEATFAGSFEVFKDSINLLSSLDVPTVTIHFDNGTQFISRETKIRCHIDMLAKLVYYFSIAKIKTQIIMENSPFGSDQASIFKEILDDVPEVGLHIDFAHALITGGLDEVDAFLKLGENGRLKHVHISDNDGKSDQHLPVNVPHKTRHPWKGIIDRLKGMGYGTEGFGDTITLEIFSEDHWNRIHSREIIREFWENS